MDYFNARPDEPYHTTPPPTEQPHAPQQSGDVARGFKLGCGAILAVIVVLIALPFISGFLLVILAALGGSM